MGEFFTSTLTCKTLQSFLHFASNISWWFQNKKLCFDFEAKSTRITSREIFNEDFSKILSHAQFHKILVVDAIFCSTLVARSSMWELKIQLSSHPHLINFKIVKKNCHKIKEKVNFTNFNSKLLRLSKSKKMIFIKKFAMIFGLISTSFCGNYLF